MYMYNMYILWKILNLGEMADFLASHASQLSDAVALLTIAFTVL